MKLASFIHAHIAGFGIVEGDNVKDISSAIENESLAEVLARSDLEAAVAQAGVHAQSYSLSDVTLLPPIPAPNRIICIGLNYRSHIAEMKREPADYPAIFFRYPDSIVGGDDGMVLSRVSEKFDYEGELAIVVGTGGRYIDAADALSAVAGYTIFNDGSYRDYQRHTHQFGAGKNFWRSGACGPWVVTKEEIGDIGAQQLTTRLNGEVMQQTGLDDLVFGVEDLIVYLSKIFPLLPGDIIATGTTGGVGAARNPQVWMKAGDKIEVEITGIGVLSNNIVEEVV